MIFDCLSGSAVKMVPMRIGYGQDSKPDPFQFGRTVIAFDLLAVLRYGVGKSVPVHFTALGKGQQNAVLLGFRYMKFSAHRSDDAGNMRCGFVP